MFRVECVILSVFVLNIYVTSNLAIQVTNFNFEPCRDSNNTFHLKDVTLSVVGSKWSASGHLLLDSTVEAPIKAYVNMERRILYRWVKIPCINDFGSCKYTDLCEFAKHYENCEKDSLAEGTVPCKCPIYKGNYTLKLESDHEFISRIEAVIKGTYRASLKMFKKQNSIACFNLKFKITT